MKKYKVIFFHPYSVYGGADLSISKLIDIIPKNYNTELITLSKYPKIKFYLKKKIKIHKLSSKRTLFSLFKFRKLIKDQAYFYDKTIVISNQNFANLITLFASRKIKKTKIILFERNHISELDVKNNFIQFSKNQIIKLLIKFFYKNANLVIGNSQELCSDIKKTAKCKTKVLYNFFDFKELKKKSKEKLRKKIKFKKNIILNVGRLEDQKNHLFLLEAFKIAYSKNKNINLLIVGDGKNYVKLLNYIKLNNLSSNVQILRGVYNALPYYKFAKLYISSSLYEGFPNVIVEAISMKLPVLSLNYKSGLKEILNNGKGGLIIKNASANKLANKIQEVFFNYEKINKKLIFANQNLKRFDANIGEKHFLNILKKI